MTELTTVRVATTPMHAKVLVALLQSEGITAIVEGDGLVDEFAMSQRLLNTAGTVIKVRNEDLERAQEILAAAAAVDEAELEAQAMAAAPPAAAHRPAKRPGGTKSHLPFVLLGAFLGGITVWMARDVIAAQVADTTERDVAAVAEKLFAAEIARLKAEAEAGGPFHDYEPISDGQREFWRQDRRFYCDLLDRNQDGFYEHVEEHGPSGAVRLSSDRDGDGRIEERIVRDASGIEARWSISAGADFVDQAVVLDDGGNVVQRLRWVRGRGYEVSDG